MFFKWQFLSSGIHVLVVIILDSSLAISFLQNMNFSAIFAVARSAFFLNKSESSSRIPASINDSWL